MKIKVFGPHTSGQQYVVHSLKRLLNKGNIPFHLEEITDISTLLSKRIESVPAIQIDNKSIVSLRSKHSFFNSLREVLSELLIESSFGDFTKILIPIEFSDDSINAFIFGHRIASRMEAVIKAPLFVNKDIKDLDFLSKKKKLNKFISNIESTAVKEIFDSSFIDSEIVIGEPYEEMLKIIQKNAIKTAIISTHNFDHISNSNMIISIFIRNSKASILTIPPEAKFHAMQNVLCFCSSKEKFHKMQDIILQYCSLFNAKFYLHIGNHSRRDNKIESQNVFCNRNITIANKTDIINPKRFQQYIFENRINFIFLDKENNILQYLQTQSPYLFDKTMIDKPILFI